MVTYISFFRGINVGGHNKVKMDELRKMFNALGMKNAATYIQSGNVIFKSDEADAEKLSKLIEDEFEKIFKFHSTVILRTLDELKNIAVKNPVKDLENKEMRLLLVMFLKNAPLPEKKKMLLENYKGPEEIHFKGREIYIYYAEGSGRSKLSNNFIESKLKAAASSRNWNTLLKLIDLGEKL